MIHPTAIISPEAKLGQNVNIWHFAHIREGATIGDNCTIGQGVYIDRNVRIGANCTIQNYACLYWGTILDNGVFIGPHAVLANDRFPRAINPDGTRKKEGDWLVGHVWLKRGVSVGAGAIIVPDCTIGEWAMVGAGAVVLGGEWAEYSLIVGSPAKLRGYVGR
jgi:UDP-2-acetamido-3-amino-2,3-dideoxy-glucuronate N-acetyltransferase